MNAHIETLEPIVDLGIASAVTQGSGAGATDFNQQPKNPLVGGLSDD